MTQQEAEQIENELTELIKPATFANS